MSRQDWRTPPSVVRTLEDFFGKRFDCDVAADEWNHVCQNWIGEDGGPGERGLFNFCNPPFGNIDPFVEDASRCYGETVMLTHNNCCSPWFRRASQSAALYLPNRRICFWHPHERPGSPDRDTVVWHFGGTKATVLLMPLPPHSEEVRRLWAEANGQKALL